MQVDLGSVRRTHIEVNLCIDALQGHAVMVHAFAMRAQSERRQAPGSAERAVRVQLTAGAGGEETHVGRIHCEFERELFTHFAVERNVGLPETHAHGGELPGFAATRELAAAAGGESTQSSSDAVEFNAEIPVAS